MPTIPFPDLSCYYCDGAQCRIKRILASAWNGIMCGAGDKKGKEHCKIFNNANNEGLIFFDI